MTIDPTPSRTFVDASAPTVAGSAHLDVALDALTSAPQHWVPVLDDDRTVIGTIAISDLVRGYRVGLLASLRQVDDAAAGSHEIEIETGSALVGCPLRSADLPEGVVVTSIQRNRDLVVPVGDTVLRAGDRLGVVGRPEETDVLRAMAEGIFSVRPSVPHPRLSDPVPQSSRQSTGRAGPLT